MRYVFNKDFYISMWHIKRDDIIQSQCPNELKKYGHRIWCFNAVDSHLFLKHCWLVFPIPGPVCYLVHSLAEYECILMPSHTPEKDNAEKGG